MQLNMKWANDNFGVPMYISVSKFGIALNQASIRALNSPAEVLIGYDENQKVLGILPVDTKIPEGAKPYPLCSTSERHKKPWIRIGCKGFVRYLEEKLETDFKDTQRRKANMENGILFIKFD